MSKLRVCCFSISVDGYGAGANQDINNPLGFAGMELHKWLVKTKTFHEMQGSKDGESGVDDDFARRGFHNVGAWILGRNMFGPLRGPWPDENWKGWWGIEPPYHTPVFVLTHHARPSLEMKGGTTFHFATEGIQNALERAKESAKGKDVRIGGGVATIQQYLKAQLIDELHLAVSPVVLGSGENLFSGTNLRELGYQVSGQAATPEANHLTIIRV